MHGSHDQAEDAKATKRDRGARVKLSVASIVSRHADKDSDERIDSQHCCVPAGTLCTLIALPRPSILARCTREIHQDSDKRTDGQHCCVLVGHSAHNALEAYGIRNQSVGKASRSANKCAYLRFDRRARTAPPSGPPDHLGRVPVSPPCAPAASRRPPLPESSLPVSLQEGGPSLFRPCPRIPCG